MPTELTFFTFKELYKNRKTKKNIKCQALLVINILSYIDPIIINPLFLIIMAQYLQNYYRLNSDITVILKNIKNSMN